MLFVATMEVNFSHKIYIQLHDIYKKNDKYIRIQL